jgi:hypothetical protein
MNYYRPSEIAGSNGEHTGKWRYTVTNDGRTYAVGYCAEQMCEHDTPDEAREHYRQYELDTAVREFETVGSAHPCEVCGEWTNKGLEVGVGIGRPFHLCDEHRTLDYVREHYTAGDVVSSY